MSACRRWDRRSVIKECDTAASDSSNILFVYWVSLYKQQHSTKNRLSFLFREDDLVFWSEGQWLPNFTFSLNETKHLGLFFLCELAANCC